MNHFDREIKIIEFFQGTSNQSIYFINKSTQAERMLNTINNTELWRNWSDNSDKDAPPPDFYSDEYKLMMEVMRIDDHANVNEKGKIINPTNKRESELYKELKDSGILENFPDVKDIIITPHTQLSTDEDHSYKKYKSNFIRVIEKHSKQVELYKSNFPNKKLVFFVLDESCAYIKTNTPYNGEDIVKDECIKASPHFWFYDRVFEDVIKNSGVDYFVWYTPFKLLRKFNLTKEIINLPRVCVYDNSKKLTTYVKRQLIRYDEKFIRSSEA